MRDLELLARIGWSAKRRPSSTKTLLSIRDDCPKMFWKRSTHPAETLIQCAICRRTCVRDHFVWNERRLARGTTTRSFSAGADRGAKSPTKNGLWDTLPIPNTSRPTCSTSRHVDLVLSLGGIDEALARRIINEVIAPSGAVAYLAARVEDGFMLLRERPPQPEPELARDRPPGSAVRTLVSRPRRCADLRASRSPARSFDADPLNPLRSNPGRRRGTIIASDGSPLADRAAASVSIPRTIAAHAVGYASQRYGAAGLEASFDSFSGARRPRRRIRWRSSRRSSTGMPQRARRAIVTTLDLRRSACSYADLSRYARAAGIVHRSAQRRRARARRVPSFDPNTSTRSSRALSNDPQSALLDRTTSGLYPPGSTFKIFTAGDALDAGLVTPQTAFIDPAAIFRSATSPCTTTRAKRPARKTLPARSRFRATSTSRRSR